MSKEEVLERALRSYMAYYDVERETPEEPFAAEAAFHSHSSTYFLTKSATIGEAESNEYVFFALQTAWTRNFSGNWTMPPGKKAWRG